MPPQQWAAQLIQILLEAKAHSETAAAAGKRRVPAAKARRIRRRYTQTLDVAFTTLPAGSPPPRQHTGDWTAPQRGLLTHRSPHRRAGRDPVAGLVLGQHRRQPVSSIVTDAEEATASRIAVVVGTSAPPVDWAPDDKAPAVTGTPRRPRSVAAFPNDKPST